MHSKRMNRMCSECFLYSQDECKGCGKTFCKRCSESLLFECRNYEDGQYCVRCVAVSPTPPQLPTVKSEV